jgi:hypothetical protein
MNSTFNIKVTKSGSMWYVGRVAGKEDMRNALKILIGNMKGRSTHRKKDNIKKSL